MFQFGRDANKVTGSQAMPDATPQGQGLALVRDCQINPKARLEFRFMGARVRVIELGLGP